MARRWADLLHETASIQLGWQSFALMHRRYENEFNAVQDVFELQVCFLFVVRDVGGWVDANTGNSVT
jgi:hypothetical protein